VIVDHETHTINIKESFLVLYALEQHGAMDYAQLIQDFLHKNCIKIKNCRGQGRSIGYEWSVLWSPKENK